MTLESPAICQRLVWRHHLCHWGYDGNQRSDAGGVPRARIWRRRGGPHIDGSYQVLLRHSVLLACNGIFLRHLAAGAAGYDQRFRAAIASLQAKLDSLLVHQHSSLLHPVLCDGLWLQRPLGVDYFGSGVLVLCHALPDRELRLVIGCRERAG